MISETQIAEIFPESQFTIEGFSDPYCLNHTVNGGWIFVYVRRVIPTKCIMGLKLVTRLRVFS